MTIDDGAGKRIEDRRQVVTSDFDRAKVSARVKLDGPGSSLANLTASWAPYWYRSDNRERRVRADGDDRTRRTRQRQVGYLVDFNADTEFALGPGRLKLIGLRHFEHEPTVTTQLTRFDSKAPDSGVRFARDARIGETVGRVEYGWKHGKNDLQLSLERADNRLAQAGRLFTLVPSGAFVEQAFPGGRDGRRDAV